MSEADTPNNHPLSESTSSVDDSTSEVPEVSETPEETQIVHLSQLRNLREVEQLPESEPSAEEEPQMIDTSTAIADEPTAEGPDDSMPRSNDADWFALAQKMRQRNRRLHEQVTQMRQALKDKQEELHQELLRSREYEVIIAQQAEEMNTIHEQLARLFHALESSHQAAQRQQILIETLSEQLQSSQERVAQLERECALTQQRYNDQSHQLLQAANTCRELRSRLYRQQQQTLQFKTALEKSLEMTSSSSTSHQQPSVKVGTNTPYIHKTQPIQPWSAEQEESSPEPSQFDALWNRPIVLDVSSTEPLAGTKPWEEPIESNLTSDPPTLSLLQRLEETHRPAPQESSDSAQTPPKTVQEPDNEASEQELEQQLLAEMSSLAEASGLTEVQAELTQMQEASFSPEEVEPNINESETNELEPFPRDIYPIQATDTQQQDTETDEIENEDIWDNFGSDEPDPSPDVALPQSNWPSPTLYPLRPPKRRKSLAAIDLPSFPRYRPI
jgi:hypothetical protein